MPPQITRERLSFAMNRKVKWRILSKRVDKFGRRYIVWLDRNNLEPTGQIERMFSPPIDNQGNVVDVPDTYANGRRGLSFPDDKPWRVELDLDGYARYLKQALHEWELRYKEIRGKLSKDQPDERALELNGPKPLDWRLIVLMSRGDPWCLGNTTRRTPAVEAIIGKAPTAREIALELAKPKDLRLDPELEALIGKGVDSSYPDELDQELQNANLDVTDEDLDEAGVDPEDLDEDDEGDLTGEDGATGDLDLDLADALEDAEDGLNSLEARLDLEEEVDPPAKSPGRRKIDPRKNRRRPAKEE